MLVKVIAEIHPTAKCITEKYSLLHETDLCSFILLDQVTLIKECESTEVIDRSIGNVLFDRIMFEAGFCQKPTEHEYPWKKNANNQPNICDCDFFADDTIFVCHLKNGKQYIIHPEENYYFGEHISSKRLKYSK